MIFLVLLLAVASSSIGEFTCSEGYTAVRDYDDRDGYCYRFVDTAGTRDELKANCESDGGHLADVGSYIEHENMMDFLHQINKETAMAWISVSDEAKEGIYVDSNGNEQPLTLWCPDAPSKLADNDEDCAITSTMGWNDIPCDETHFGFCESEPIY